MIPSWLLLSNEIVAAGKEAAATDQYIKRIDEITNQINEKKVQQVELENELKLLQVTRPEILIKWRDSILWCLEVDSKNDGYFIKNADSVCKCIAYKHRIEITPGIRNKIASTLSTMFTQKIIGRYFIDSKNANYYGLKEFFKGRELNLLKDEYMGKIKKLVA